MDSGNWEAELPTGDTNKQYYINVCRSLVKQKGLCKGYSNVITSTSGLEFKYNSGPQISMSWNPLKILLLATDPWKCPSTAASCLKVGDEYWSLGQVHSGPTWDGNVLMLQYTSGQACSNGSRNRISIIRFQCDKNKVVRTVLKRWSAKMFDGSQAVKHAVNSLLSIKWLSKPHVRWNVGSM